MRLLSALMVQYWTWHSQAETANARHVGHNAGLFKRGDEDSLRKV